MNLMEIAEAAPPNVNGKQRTCWSDYREPFFVLLQKGYSKAQAAEILGNASGLTAEKKKRLYNAAKMWPVQTAL